MRRLTGSPLAGLVAPVLWLVSPVIYLPMTWTSAYNQILCAFFLLSAFLLLLLYIDTSRTKYYIGMWAMFLLGFGALELNVVFPAIACLYTVLFARRFTRIVAPMFVVAVAYTLWHRSIGQSLSGGVYAMDFHPQRILWAFGQYLWLAVSAAPAARLHELSSHTSDACSIAALISIAVALAVLLWKRLWLGAFFCGWFVLTVAPYLPLAEPYSGLLSDDSCDRHRNAWRMGVRVGNAGKTWREGNRGRSGTVGCRSGGWQGMDDVGVVLGKIAPGAGLGSGSGGSACKVSRPMDCPAGR